MRCSDALRPWRRASLPSLGATLRRVLIFRSRRSRPPDRGPGVHLPVPAAGWFRRETFRASQVPGEPRCAYALFSDPGRTDATRPLTVGRRGPRSQHDEGSRIVV